MKVSSAQRVCELPQDMPVHNFAIEANPQMIRILSDQLYTEKELAILRELVANAWDAHVEAGTTDIPIRVHLPTEIEPWFAVRDAGTGLSPGQITTLYTTYGRSNKTHTNDLIGGFGLGSKSPFAYTDQFTVISRFEGTEYTYQAFIQTDGIPGCALISEQPTASRNGLEVHVPIADASGYYRFEAAAKQILPFVPGPVEVNLREPPELPSFLIDLQNPAPGVKRAAISPHGTGLAFVQGLVPYNADQYEIMLHDRADQQLPTWYNLFSGNKVYIWVDVGTLEVTASRESLSLTNTVRAKAQALLFDAMTALAEAMAQRLDEAETWWEWAQLAHNAVLMPSEVPDRLGNRRVDRIILQDHGLERHATRVWRDFHVKAGFRRTDATSLFFNYLREQTHVLVKPKHSYPYREYLRRYFNDNPFVHGVYILTGKIDEIRATLGKLGLPHKVEEIPKIKVPRSQAARQALGAKQYYGVIAAFKDGQWSTTTIRATAGRVLDEMVTDDTVGIDTQPHRLDTLCNLLNGGLLEWADTDTRFLVLDIDRHHTKVRERFFEEISAITLPDLIEELHVNHATVCRYATAKRFLDDQRFTWLATYPDEYQVIEGPARAGLAPFKELMDARAALHIANQHFYDLLARTGRLTDNALELWIGEFDRAGDPQLNEAVKAVMADIEAQLDLIKEHYPELHAPLEKTLARRWTIHNPIHDAAAALYARVAEFYAQQEKQE